MATFHWELPPSKMVKCNSQKPIYESKTQLRQKRGYDIQAKILSDIFEEKGYNSKDLVKTRLAVGDVKREDLFKKKKVN